VSQPTTHDYLRVSAIAAALSLLTLVVALAGAGLTAFIVLAVAVGPISFYGNQLARRAGGGPAGGGRTRPGRRGTRDRSRSRHGR